MFPKDGYVGPCDWTTNIALDHDRVLEIGSIRNKFYLFDIEFKPDDVLKPLSTKNHTIDVGSILKINSKCRNLAIYRAVGTWFTN